ncbi:PTS system, Lactose/Cellobiose specific IIA subunit [Acididesulfobacillus acetoxydans]|uniref:PTS system, Lactose/Cellobiose specific IIA subunit n=1 Tax=Acididesulfobacillus acetoxydans TaxID=1561005 RepID=A0A8S0Y4J5_9FIRM|nr:PTS lactose/cellobiose transporter subunit IIA [Acididesulfobacillus acetoxydans]CAA7603025.1 PTS system, Lactose/Cellobiose specific IIA subunit [Acididesulfobacillus acetoxydans]CEJ08984.1 Phosphotransferase system cellobiose-specific component IIA [Acididesulfobacillus acetoxydans]
MENANEKNTNGENPNPDLEQIVFNLVLHGGNARAKAYEALDAAEGGNFAQAEKNLEEADEEFYEGHKYQNLLVQGQLEKDITPNFLVIHAQDQLMTALAEKTLIKREISLYKRVHELERKIR